MRLISGFQRDALGLDVAAGLLHELLHLPQGFLGILFLNRAEQVIVAALPPFHEEEVVVGVRAPVVAGAGAKQRNALQVAGQVLIQSADEDIQLPVSVHARMIPNGRGRVPTPPAAVG